MTKVREGSHWGIVVSTKDPEHRDRLKVHIPEIMAEEVSDWIEPDSLMVSKFKVGDRVWVRFLDGDTRHGVYHVPWDRKRATVRNTLDDVEMTHPSGQVRVRAPGSTAYVSGDSSSVNLAGGAVHCMGKDTAGYVPCVASAFEVASSPELKHDVRALDFDPVEAVRNAPARLWKYLPGYSADQRDRVGPMASDLPEVARSGDNVDTLALIGILWETVYQLISRIESLES